MRTQFLLLALVLQVGCPTPPEAPGNAGPAPVPGGPPGAPAGGGSPPTPGGDGAAPPPDRGGDGGTPPAAGSGGNVGNGGLVSAQEAFQGAIPKFESIIGDDDTITITINITGSASGQLDFSVNEDLTPKLIHLETFEGLSGPMTITAPAKLDETVFVTAHSITPPMYSESQEITLKGRDMTLEIEMKEGAPPPPPGEPPPPGGGPMPTPAQEAPPPNTPAPGAQAPDAPAPDAPAPDAPAPDAPAADAPEAP